jgi:hypothetical protein
LREGGFRLEVSAITLVARLPLSPAKLDSGRVIPLQNFYEITREIRARMPGACTARLSPKFSSGRTHPVTLFAAF